MAGVMIAKDVEQLTPKIFQKIVIKLLEPTTASEKQGIQLQTRHSLVSNEKLALQRVAALLVEGLLLFAVGS